MKWTIGRKIVAAFAVAIAVLLAMGVATYVSTGQLLHLMQERQKSALLEFEIQNLLSSVKDAETGQRGYIITFSDPYLEPYTKGTADANGTLERLEGLAEDHSVRKANLDQLKSFVGIKFDELAKTIAMRKNEGFEAAAAEVATNKGKNAMDQIRAIVEKMRVEEENRLNSLAEKVETSATNTKETIVGGAIGAAVVLLFAAWLLARNISTPLAEMTNASRRIAEGELTAAMGADRRTDEVGELRSAFSRMNSNLGQMASVARRIAAGDLTAAVAPQSERDELGTSFATMQRNLRELMKQTLEAVNVLSTSATEITASVTQVAAGTAETAAAITETTATVEEVKQTTALNSEKVRQVSDNAQKAVETAEHGRRAVGGTIDGMNRIRQQTEAIGASMMRLSEQTLAIGEIIASVNDLAEQSNILAVNASIEAAKAGEHGKGFGVVAQEVRNLSEQSKQATTQVRSILGEIQKATSAAMMATEQGSKAVSAGLQQSEQAGQSIAGLADSIAQSAQAAMQIAASNQQQVVGMDQVAIAIRNIQEASVQNASAVRQVQASATSLSELGHKLKALVERYKT